MTEPRGLRNNNPGNIDRQPGVTWQGQHPEQTDPRFVRFVSPVWGIRAMAKVLLTYQHRRRAADGSPIDTVQDIINRWAPPSENDTDAYVRAVALAVGVEPKQVIDVNDPAIMLPLLRAIIHHENGTQPYSDALLLQAMEAAGMDVNSVHRPKPAGGVYGLVATQEDIMTPTETKPAIKSLGIVGPLIGAGVLLLNQYVFKGQVILDTDVTALIDAGGVLWTTGTAIYGRFRAHKQISGIIFQKRP
jgi:hypothetical protein